MKGLRKNCRGFTLVEIIVTFALTALFVTSASLVLSSFMRSHVTASAVAGEQNVATILANTVTDELGSARYEAPFCFKGALPDGSTSGLSETSEDGKKPPAEEGQLLLGEDGDGNSVIWYVSAQSGNKVTLGLKDGYLLWTYYVKKDTASDEYEKVEWKLGENVYDGCTVEAFRVEQLLAKRSDGSEDPATGEPTNCLKVTIRLTSHRVDHNSFTISRSVECRNLRAENIVHME